MARSWFTQGLSRMDVPMTFKREIALDEMAHAVLRTQQDESHGG